MAVRHTASKRAEARIRQQCCLGLGSEVVMPDILRDLHRLIPSHANTFYWVDEAGGLANAYDEQPDACRILPEYIECFYNKAEKDVHPGFTRIAQTAHGILDNATFFRVSGARLRNSAFYARIMRPQRYHFILQMPIRLAGRTRAILQLQRSAREPDFSLTDRRNLQRLHGFVINALEAPATDPARSDAWQATGDSGLLLADERGNLVSASACGRKLLFLSRHARLQPPLESHVACSGLIAKLCQSVARIEAMQLDAPPPVHIVHNAWGRFIFTAHRLPGGHHEKAMVGIHVRREVPLPVRLVSATRHAPLSQRQAQIAALLAVGLTHQAIAARLGIKRNTVISHSRLIYDRLDVHDAHGLREALLRLTESARDTHSACSVHA